MLILKAGLDRGVVTENKRIVVVSHESRFARWQITLYNTAYQRSFFKLGFYCCYC